MLAPDANALGKPGSGVIIYVSGTCEMGGLDCLFPRYSAWTTQHCREDGEGRRGAFSLLFADFLPQLGKLNIENNTYTYDKKILIKGAWCTFGEEILVRRERSSPTDFVLILQNKIHSYCFSLIVCGGPCHFSGFKHCSRDVISFLEQLVMDKLNISAFTLVPA